MNKFNQEQKAEGSDFEPFGSVPVKSPRKKVGPRMPWRQHLLRSPLPLQDKEPTVLGLLGPPCWQWPRADSSAERMGSTAPLVPSPQ